LGILDTRFIIKLLQSAFDVVAPVPVATSAEYTDSSGWLSVFGSGFDSPKGSGKVQASPTTEDAWIDATQYFSWSNGNIICTFDPYLAIGSYDLRVYQNGQYSEVLVAEFSVTEEPSAPEGFMQSHVRIGMFVGV
jgi:hypothetical protein